MRDESLLKVPCTMWSIKYLEHRGIDTFTCTQITKSYMNVLHAHGAGRTETLDTEAFPTKKEAVDAAIKKIVLLLSKMDLKREKLEKMKLEFMDMKGAVDE